MRSPALILAALLAPILVSAQTFPSIADVSKTVSVLQPGMEVQAIAVDSTGNVYLAGTSTQGFTGAKTNIGPLGDVDLFVIKTNATVDQVIYSASIGGSGTETLRGIQVDTSGNAYLLGTSTSRDFTYTSSVNPLLPIGTIALKLNAAGTALTYASQLGNSMTPLALDVDSTGAAYLVGSMNAQDLTTSTGALKPAPGAGANPGDYMGFVLKLSPAGNTFQAATYYGAPNKSVEAISIRSNGILIISDGTLALLNTGLSQQVSSATIGMTSPKMTFDSTGNVYLVGASTAATGGTVLRKYASTGLAVQLDKTYPFATTNASQAIAVAPSGRIILFGQPVDRRVVAYNQGIDPNSQFHSTNGLQPCLANIAAPNGTAGVSIDTSGGLIGASGGAIPAEQGFVVLDATGTVLLASYTPMRVAQATVAPTTGRIYLATSETLFGTPRTIWTGVVRLNIDALPADKVAPGCVVHGGPLFTAPLSPGAVMTIFGSHLGPATGVSATLPGGVVEKTLGGVSITVDGKPAPMLYSRADQLNFITPWTVRTDGSSVPVCVTFDSTVCLHVGTTVSVPGPLLAYVGNTALVAALNQDYSFHQPSNPAAPGSVVQIFMTGFGSLSGTLVDGGVANSGSQLVQGTVTATTDPPPTGGCGLFNCAVATGGHKDVGVGYAGAAPSLILGANQVNLQIPDDMPSGPQTFTISFTPQGAMTPVTTSVLLFIK